MIRINLAPHVDQSGGRKQIVRDFLIIGVLSISIHFLIDFHSREYDLQSTEFENKIAELEKSKASLKKELEQSAEIKKRSEQINSRAAKVKMLGEGRKIAVILLDSLQSKHPERMWFTKIIYSTKNKNLQLVGYALDHTVIADYMRRLKEIGQFDSGNLTELKEFVPQQLIGFDLQKTGIKQKIKSEIGSLGQISLKKLVSSEELIQGVTLQKFEINIQLTSG